MAVERREQRAHLTRRDEIPQAAQRAADAIALRERLALLRVDDANVGVRRQRRIGHAAGREYRDLQTALRQRSRAAECDLRAPAIHRQRIGDDDDVLEHYRGTDSNQCSIRSHVST
jgi:hypothetical protein